MTRRAIELDKYVKGIDKAIDLNRILARAQAEQHQIKLITGIYNPERDRIVWGACEQNLPYFYKLAYGLLYNFIQAHQDKIIKINTTNNGLYPLNRNIVIHVPIDIDLDRIKREYASIIRIIS